MLGDPQEPKLYYAKTFSYRTHSRQQKLAEMAYTALRFGGDTPHDALRCAPKPVS